MDRVAQLKNLPKRHDFLICLDSDGCVFDTMELKHQQCFCPAFIEHFGLQAVSPSVREVWLFVNLYSQHRGCNRFLAVQQTMALMRARPEVAAAGLVLPPMPELTAWLRTETKLGNAALEAQVQATGHAELAKLLTWSKAVDQLIAKTVSGIPPFPGVREFFAAAAPRADLMVVSQTQLEALTREWQEHGLDHYLTLIAGQEHGSKTEHLKYALEGKTYPREQVLMIGDADGDLKAAQANGILFFPINPRAEAASWAELVRTGLDRFFAGTFAGQYQAELIAKFDHALSRDPPWLRDSVAKA